LIGKKDLLGVLFFVVKVPLAPHGIENQMVKMHGCGSSNGRDGIGS
jgi:hypothetical protein